MTSREHFTYEPATRKGRQVQPTLPDPNLMPRTDSGRQPPRP
ncbi:hypothetical protein [Kutzneria kofuensis]